MLERIYGFTVLGNGCTLQARYAGEKDKRLIGSGPAVKLLKRRLNSSRLCHTILLLVCTGSFSRFSTPSIVKTIKRDKHKSLVFVSPMVLSRLICHAKLPFEH